MASEGLVTDVNVKNQLNVLQKVKSSTLFIINCIILFREKILGQQQTHIIILLLEIQTKEVN
jgi:hypothetical protein